MKKLKILLVFLFSLASQAQSFAFQGQLTDDGVPAKGNFDLSFSLFDFSVGGKQLGASILATNIQITSGVFSYPLNFPATNIAAGGRFLQVLVKASGAVSWTPLTPRQEIAAVPIALYALSGNVGPQGLKGEVGAGGAAGPAGPQGLKGEVGASGAAGPAGPQGLKGEVGAGGAAGPQGLKGDTGVAGPAGPSGVLDTSVLTNYARLSVPDISETAVATATVLSGRIIGVSVINQGQGYESSPIVTLSDSTGSGGQLVPIVIDSKLVAVSVVNSGSNYSANPIVTISSPPKFAKQTITSDITFTGKAVFSGSVSGAIAFEKPVSIEREIVYSTTKPGMLWGTVTLSSSWNGVRWPSETCGIEVGDTPQSLVRLMEIHKGDDQYTSSSVLPFCIPVAANSYYKITASGNPSVVIRFTPFAN